MIMKRKEINQLFKFLIVLPHFCNQKVSRPKNMAVLQPKMVQWPILNNSHAYPFCKTTPGTTSYLVLAIAPFMSVKLAEIGHETIQSVKVRVHHRNNGRQFDWF